MTETMLERVASAIEMVSLKYEMRRLEGMPNSDPGKGIWNEFASAAIEAMRKPTHVMVKAGCVSLDATTSSYEEPDSWIEETFHCWQAMIDQILGEGK